MKNCLTCGGMIPEPGKAYGYAGPICQCTVPPRYQQTARDAIMISPADRLMSTKLIAERDALKAKLASAESVIESFLKKTDVYMRLYPDDKELYRYRDEARDYLKSEGGG